MDLTRLAIDFCLETRRRMSDAEFQRVADLFAAAARRPKVNAEHLLYWARDENYAIEQALDLFRPEDATDVHFDTDASLPINARSL